MAARRVRRTSPPLPTPAATDGETVATWLLVALAAPRLARMLYPAIWVEDDCYLQSAFAIASGLRPYVDFIHPQMPLLEWLAAAYITVVGASHLRMELINEAAIYATSVLTFVVARRAFGRPAAVAAALLLATSSLVFRYHVWARELFVAPLLLASTLAILDRDASARTQAGRVAVLLTIACAIKLTAGIAAAALLALLAILERRPLRALASGAGLLSGLAVLSAFCYWRYGFEFIFQTFLFHLLKGHDVTGASPFYPASIFDVLVPLSALGLARIAIERRADRPVIVVLTLLAAEFLFYGVLSPTAWGHNYLEVLPFVAIVAGVGAAGIARALGDVIAGGLRRRHAWVPLAIAAAVLMVSLTSAAPLVNENWERRSVYGFGFVPRAELERLARALSGTTSPAEEVIAPAFIAFEANRRQLIRYPENYGVVRAGEAAYREGGFALARLRMGNADFFKLIDETSHIWNDRVIAAVAPGTAESVHAFIADSTIQMLPLLNASDDALWERGFEPALRTEHFTLWIRDRANGGQ